MKETVGYRARKWAVQRLTSNSASDQFERLSDANWDVLVVLDACRLDSLRKVADWPIERTVSPASCTPRWLKAVSLNDIFRGKHIVSGNPQYRKVDADLGHASLDPFWERHWDDELQTTPPKPILDRVDTVVAEGNDEVVAHLQQPHWPYVATLGDRWMLAYEDLGPWSKDGSEIHSLQVAMQRGLIDIDEARRAYNASVASIWETVAEYLVEWVDRGLSVVVTADHGETFGRLRDYGFYEHPCGCHIDPLVSVPFVHVSPIESDRNADKVEDRLRALGYAD